MKDSPSAQPPAEHQMELIVDLFAGGGGASTGIFQALGRHPDIAINHDPQAIAMHRANHPDTKHIVEDIWQADPTTLTAGQPVGLLWASPSCTHFSKARGGLPLNKQLRSLGWAVIWWAAKTKPRLIILENVTEWASWGPVDQNGRMIPHRKGESFLRWKKRLEFYGYTVEKRELAACDFGAPTTRKRLFVIARRDGNPIVWPRPTHGPNTNRPYRTASEIIDFNLPCPSIFGRKKPLADATLKRIAKGIMRYVLNNPKPFIVPGAHNNGHSSEHGVNTTVDNGAEFAWETPFIPSHNGHHSDEGTLRGREAHEALRSQKTENRSTVVSGFIAKHYSDRGQRPGSHLGEPIDTITSIDHHGLVATHLAKYSNETIRSPLFDAMPTMGAIEEAQRPVSAPPTPKFVDTHLNKTILAEHSSLHQSPKESVDTTDKNNQCSQVSAFLTQYYGTTEAAPLQKPLHTITSNDHFGLVNVYIGGVQFVITDVGLRMLTPKELFAAQGFPQDYIFEVGVNEHGQKIPLTKSAQVRMCGNSVPPAFAKALVEANYLCQAREIASD